MKPKLLSILLALWLLTGVACTAGKHHHKSKMTKQFHKKEKLGHTPKKGNLFQRLFSSN